MITGGPGPARDRRPFPPRSVPGRGRAWYRVDLHVHSDLSYAADRTPAAVVAEARAAGLDGFATTEHNTAEGHGRWAGPAGDHLLVILGQEVVTRTGHWLALGLAPGRVIDGDYRALDGVIDRHTARVRDGGGLCVAAHPFVPYPSGGFGYRYRGFEAVEVWNGLWSSDRPWNADNGTALAEWGRTLVADLGAGVAGDDGPWRPAVGGSDAHQAGQVGTPHTVVLADTLGVDDVLAGLRAGRSWIAGSAQVELELTAECEGRVAGIGERLSTPDGDALVRVRVRVAGVPAGTVTVHTDLGTVHRAQLPPTGSDAVDWTTTPAASAFVRIELRHPDGSMAALTNPVVLARL